MVHLVASAVAAEAVLVQIADLAAQVPAQRDGNAGRVAHPLIAAARSPGSAGEIQEMLLGREEMQAVRATRRVEAESRPQAEAHFAAAAVEALLEAQPPGEAGA